ncbi:MAG: sigma-70 family RNA polymerase sigma factor [Deltaproteobacteria bacterium]|nr:sigma-70 family RNA polymerase sigma factor [Deltaproteobacteria bacterium]
MSTGVKAGAAESAAKDNKERPDLKKSNPRRPNENQEKSHTKTIEPDGDEAESWVDRYGEILYRFALVRVKDPVTAEDLVQETFLAALRGRENFQGRSSLKSWLVAILKHKIVDHIRKSVKEKVLENFDSQADQVETRFDDRGKWKFRPQNWTVNPVKLYQQKEFMDILYRCLAQLRGRQAEVFMLREIDGLSTEEICKELNITATNSWVILYRARMGLRGCLEENWMSIHTQRSASLTLDGSFKINDSKGEYAIYHDAVYS